MTFPSNLWEMIVHQAAMGRTDGKQDAQLTQSRKNRLPAFASRTEPRGEVKNGSLEGL